MTRWLCPLLALACAEAVDPAERDGCEPARDATLEVGKGEAEFLPADADEGRSILIHGFQGGYHSFVSVRADGMAVDGPWDMEIVGYLAGEERVRVPVRRDPVCDPEARRGEILGTWLIWGIRPDQLEMLHQQPVRIEVSATDRSGREATGAAEVVLWSELAWE